MGIFLACAPLQASDWEGLKREIREKFPHVDQVGTAALAVWLADEEREPPVLLDARAEKEYAVSHLPGAVWAPDLKAALRVLGPPPGEAGASGAATTDDVSGGDPSRPVIVYCSVGYRSAQMADRLRERGYESVFNLEGSLFEWANEGNAVVRGDSVVTAVHPYDRDWGRFLEERYWPEDWK
ncbi:MAG: rhodanese-like domain-containing protein [Gemmatimonadetes bacterium]|nr:rhodanese-like domain-containing protein [Gemmatimonadota bacterium]